MRRGRGLALRRNVPTAGVKNRWQRSPAALECAPPRGREVRPGHPVTPTPRPEAGAQYTVGMFAPATRSVGTYRHRQPGDRTHPWCPR